MYSGASYGFNAPNRIAVDDNQADDGTHVWVTNSGGNWVTELTAG